MSHTEMIVTSENYYYNPVDALKMIRNGLMDLQVINNYYVYDYVYTTTLKNGERLQVIIKNPPVDPNEYIHRYIVSVSKPYKVSGKSKHYHFDTEILNTENGVPIRIDIFHIQNIVYVPYRDGQTIREILYKLPLLVDEITEDMLEYTKLMLAKTGRTVSLDSVYDGYSWFTLKDD